MGTFQDIPVLPPSPLCSSHPDQTTSLERGRPHRHHSALGDYQHKGGLGGAGRSTCATVGERVEESPSTQPILRSFSSPPPLGMMTTLSVWITTVRCVSTQSLMVIKGVPPHLGGSVPLSAYLLLFHLTIFRDSPDAVTLQNGVKIKVRLF